MHPDPVSESPQIIDADLDAKQVLVNYHNEIADRREGDLRDVTGFAARWGEYAWRLALVVHAARLGDEAASPLTLGDAQVGIALAKWYAWQQLDVLRAGRHLAKVEKFDKVMILFKGDKKEITARDVYRAGITPREEPEIAKALLEQMVAGGLLTSEDKPTERNGHIQRVYKKLK